MQKWEYLIVTMGDMGVCHDPVTDKWRPINELGAEGWELVNVVADPSGDFYEVGFFKRSIPEDI